MINNESIEELQAEIGYLVEHMYGEYTDMALMLVELIMKRGARIVQFGDNYYLISDGSVLDADAKEDIQLLECVDLGDFPSVLFSYLWADAVIDIKEMAMNIQDLVDEAELDQAVWLPEGDSAEDEKDLIRRMYDHFGPDIFQLQPEYRDDYAQYILPFNKQQPRCSVAEQISFQQGVSIITN